MALISRSTNSIAVLAIEPPTVIIPGRHGVTGPSSIGGTVVCPGGAHTVPPGLGAFGAAHPALAASNCFSLRIGLGTSGLPSNTRR